MLYWLMLEELSNIAELIRRIREGPCSSIDCEIMDIKIWLRSGITGNDVSSIIESDLVKDRAYLTFRLRLRGLVLIIKLRVKGCVSLGELRRLSDEVINVINSMVKS